MIERTPIMVVPSAMLTNRQALGNLSLSGAWFPVLVEDYTEACADHVIQLEMGVVNL